MWRQGVHRLQARSRVMTLVLILVPVLPVAAQEAVRQIDPEAVFARVNDRTITVGDYARELRRVARDSFYHGQPPGGDMAGFQKQVAEQLVEQLLMAAEARRRGLEPDREQVEQAMGRLAARGADTDTLAAERQRLERNSLAEQLERIVREAPSPSREEVHGFYRANPELFTEPAKLKLSVILLRVRPDDPSSAWKAARAEAEGLLERLKNGADFAEMARIHSADGTASEGGDMGYVHLGMLAPEIEMAAREMQPGELSEPIAVLEGIVLVRLDNRRQPKLLGFTAVADRAEGLLQRERAEAALTTLLENLRQTADVELREELLEPEGFDSGDRLQE